MPRFPDEIIYSDKYQDEEYEYRNVILTKDLYKRVAKKKLLQEIEWRALGIQGSVGWIHYEIYAPEPHIILMRKPINN